MFDVHYMNMHALAFGIIVYMLYISNVNPYTYNQIELV